MAARIKLVKISVLVAGLLAVVLAGTFIIRGKIADGRERQMILSSLPQLSELSNLSGPLEPALQRAYAQVEDGADPMKGLERITMLYQANGFLNEAIMGHDLLLQLQPENPVWPHLLAFILAGYGQLDVALPLWERCIRLDPDYLPAHLRRAEGLLKLNRPEEAEEAYRRASAMDANNPYVDRGLARIAIAEGDYLRARGHLMDAMEHSDGRIGPHLLVSVLERLGELDKADVMRGSSKTMSVYADIPDPWLVSIIDYCYDPFQLISAGGLAASVGDTDRGIELMKKAILFDPGNASAHFQLGYIYYQNGFTDLAFEMYERAGELDPSLADAWLFRANLYYELGAEQKGEEVLTLGLVHNPDTAALHLAWGERLLEKGRYSEAGKSFLRAIELRPEEPEPYVLLARIYLREGDIDKGREILLDSLEAEAANPMALVTMAMITVSLSEEIEAKRWIEKIKNQPRIAVEDREDIRKKFIATFGYDPM